MSNLPELLLHLTVWHWVGLGIALLALEVMVGTFDLLWIALAAFAAALWAIAAPPGLREGQGQLIFFSVAALVMVVLGRTAFRGVRHPPTSHPNLNDRLAGMVGQHGVAATAFSDGEGRVRLGDTEWPARAEAGASIPSGASIEVASAANGVLTVRPS